MMTGLKIGSTKLFLTLEIILILFSGVATLALADLSHSSSRTELLSAPGSVTIFLNGDQVGDHPGWNNTSPGPTITIFNGQTVHLLLNATDVLMHNWFIDTLQNSSPDPNGISSPDFSAFTTKVLNFTFTPIVGQNIPATGNWTYRCKYHPPTMYGTIRVVTLPDFTLTAATTSLVSTVNAPVTTTISIGSVAQFTGTIRLSTTGSDGLESSINPTTITVPGTATFSASASTAGNYSATITGTNGTVTHPLNIKFTASDFTISTDHSISTVQIGTTATSTVSINSVNHFPGPVSLTTNSTNCILDPTTITPELTSKLTCNFQNTGTFHVTITANQGSLSHTTTTSFDVTNIQETAGATTPNWFQITEIVAAVAVAATVGLLIYSRRTRSQKARVVEGS